MQYNVGVITRCNPEHIRIPALHLYLASLSEDFREGICAGKYCEIYLDSESQDGINYGYYVVDHDSQKVVSGSERTLKMWDISTGYCKKDLLSELSGVWQVKFNDRRCVAAVQRGNITFIEVSRSILCEIHANKKQVLDFGAARDGIPESDRGRRLVVDEDGQPIDIDEDVVPET